MKAAKQKTAHYSTHYYSGGASVRWWRRVGALSGTDHAALYALGCALQNLEAYVLNQLRMAEQFAMQTKKRKR